jgi:hypothetical protein
MEVHPLQLVQHIAHTVTLVQLLQLVHHVLHVLLVTMQTVLVPELATNAQLVNGLLILEQHSAIFALLVHQTLVLDLLVAQAVLLVTTNQTAVLDYAWHAKQVLIQTLLDQLNAYNVLLVILQEMVMEVMDKPSALLALLVHLLQL